MNRHTNRLMRLQWGNRAKPPAPRRHRSTPAHEAGRKARDGGSVQPTWESTTLSLKRHLLTIPVEQLDLGGDHGVVLGEDEVGVRHPHLNSGASSASDQRGRRRLLRSSLAGLFALFLLSLGPLSIGGVLTASAHDDCQNQGNTDGSPWTCGYTQLDPTHNWPADGSSPHCSVCAWWDMPNGGPGNVDADFTGAYPTGGGIQYYNDLIAAMQDWSGQPYNSPWMYQCSGSNCQYSQIHVGSKDEGGGSSYACALTYVYVDSSNRVTSSTIMFNNDGQTRWWDGPPASGQSGCDAKATAYHEEGHAFTLGHSSAEGNAMYWQGGAESIGGNDQTGLDAIYGPYQGSNGSSSGSGGGGSGCGTCQALGSHQVSISCDTLSSTACAILEGYLSKAWDMSQGVSLPNPVSELTGADGCLQYFFAGQYAPWLNCQIGVGL